MKFLAGEEGRVSLYALAAAMNEIVLAFHGERDELRALARAGADRVGAARPPTVIRIKDVGSFAESATRLSWKRVPNAVLVDADGMGSALDSILRVLSAIAPVVVAVSSLVESGSTSLGSPADLPKARG